MIPDFFWNLINGLLSGAIDTLPEDNPLSTSQVDWTMLSSINYFLPVSEMAGLLGSFMLLAIPFALISLFMHIVITLILGRASKV